MSEGYNTQAPPTSRAIAVFTGTVGLALLAVATGFVELVGAAGVAGVLFTIAGIVDAPERPVRNVLAGFVFVLGICAIGAAMGAGLTADPGGSDTFFSEERLFSFVLIVAVGAVTYGLAVLSTGTEIGQNTRLLCVNGGSLVAVPFFLFVLMLVAFQAVAGPLPWLEVVFSWIVTPDTAALGLVTLCGLVGIAAGTLALAVRRLPVRILISKSSQPVMRARLNRLTDWLLRIAVSALVTGVIAFLVLPSLWESIVATFPASVVTAIIVVATEPPIRFVLLGAVGLALLFVLLVGVLSRIRPESVQRLQRLLAYGAVAFVAVGMAILVSADRIVDLMIVVTGANETITGVRETFGSLPLLVGLFTIAVVVPTTLFMTGAVCGSLGILTRRTAAPVVAAGGLITAAIAASQLGSFTVANVVVAGLAFVVWDIGTYGHQLNIELDRGGRRVELVHAGAIVAVTVAGISAFYVVRWVADAVALQGTLTTALITLLGLILILAAGQA